MPISRLSDDDQAGGGVEVLWPTGATAKPGEHHVIPAF